MAKTVAHICILVRDIDQAIEDYTKIFSVAAPQLLGRKVAKQERYAGTDKYVTAFFSAEGDGCDIQLLQPPDQQSPLYKRLEKRGEGVHHIAFTSSHIEDTYQQLVDNGVALNVDEPAQETTDSGASDIKSFFILPGHAHGVLVEMIDKYKVVDGMLSSE